jgi:hypothetical protein
MSLVPVFAFTLCLAGCGSKPAPTVVEQPQKSPEQLAKEAADYDAQMDAN